MEVIFQSGDSFCVSAFGGFVSFTVFRSGDRTPSIKIPISLALSKELEDLGNKIGVIIKLQREDIFKSMQRI